jgi:hypothetical protein
MFGLIFHCKVREAPIMSFVMDNGLANLPPLSEAGNLCAATEPWLTGAPSCCFRAR